eukprot:10786930-Ditylum_brightwellii.AAC.1
MIQCSIASLLQNGFIKKSTEGEWLSRATLAPTPHQEAVALMNNFVWHCCINYIHLHQIVQLYAYLIPRCDDA